MGKGPCPKGRDWSRNTKMAKICKKPRKNGDFGAKRRAKTYYEMLRHVTTLDDTFRYVTTRKTKSESNSYTLYLRKLAYFKKSCKYYLKKLEYFLQGLISVYLGNTLDFNDWR